MRVKSDLRGQRGSIQTGAAPKGLTLLSAVKIGIPCVGSTI